MAGGDRMILSVIVLILYTPLAVIFRLMKMYMK